MPSRFQNHLPDSSRGPVLDFSGDIPLVIQHIHLTSFWVGTIIDTGPVCKIVSKPATFPTQKDLQFPFPYDGVTTTFGCKIFHDRFALCRTSIQLVLLQGGQWEPGMENRRHSPILHC